MSFDSCVDCCAKINKEKPTTRPAKFICAKQQAICHKQRAFLHMKIAIYALKYLNNANRALPKRLCLRAGCQQKCKIVSNKNTEATKAKELTMKCINLIKTNLWKYGKVPTYINTPAIRGRTRTLEGQRWTLNLYVRICAVISKVECSEPKILLPLLHAYASMCVCVCVLFFSIPHFSRNKIFMLSCVYFS